MDKHPALVVHSEQPFNAGPPPALLREQYITPTSVFFVRNHGAIPTVDVEPYRLVVRGQVLRPLALTLAELRAEFPATTLAATLQCAGLRRSELFMVKPIPGELGWEADAISTAEWRGVALAAVLEAAGLEQDAGHVAFLGLDTVARQGQSFGFGGSLPLHKALMREVLLAYEMNGAPLSPVHGFPLRVIAPGYIGARSVKWLGEIVVQSEPSDNYFQQHAYKLFPPEVDATTVDWSQGEMLGQLKVNAVICEPGADTMLTAGSVPVRGYAIGTAGQSIELVEVSADGGVTWKSASLTSPRQPWTWSFWEAELTLPAGRHELVVRARDVTGDIQPADIASQWNVKGYMNTAWQRVAVTVS